MDELSWRKYPRSLITDERLDYASFCLPRELACAPYMFMNVMYSKCDDDGVYDIDDGIIFSRLMRIGAPEDVFTIAELLVKRGMILKVINNSNIYMIADWEPPQRNNIHGRTAEERRAKVAEKIAAERKYKEAVNAKYQAPTIPTPPPVVDTVDFETVKNCAAKKICNFDDKNAENVVKQREREREREIRGDETEERGEERDTHTQKESETFRAAEALQVTQENINTESQTKEPEKAESAGALLARELAGEVVSVQAISQQKERGALYDDTRSVFVMFFAKNCLGFCENDHTSALNELSERMLQLQDEVNFAPSIANVFCTQFLKIAQTESHYFSNYPITPEGLLKPGMYSHVVTAASKILLTQHKGNDFWKKQADQDRLQAEQDREAVSNFFKEQCLKYKIDPADPDAQLKIIQAKAHEAQNGKGTG